MVAPLTASRLVVVTGKGGVGKSVVAAALGRLLASAGRRVLILETDPRESQHALLGCDPSGGAAVVAGERLTIQNVDALAAIEERVREQLRVRTVADRVCRSEAFRTFVAGAPGLGEVAVLGHALRVVQGRAPGIGRHDVVVLDAPATGHGVSFVDAPRVVADVVGSGPFGDLAREVAAHVQNPSATEVVAVTLAEEMPVDELLELDAALRRTLARPAGLVVVNSLHPPVPSRGLPKGAATDLWRRRRRIEERELARIAAHGFAMVAELPLVAADRGPALVDELASVLGRRWANSAGEVERAPRREGKR